MFVNEDNETVSKQNDRIKFRNDSYSFARPGGALQAQDKRKSNRSNK